MESASRNPLPSPRCSPCLYLARHIPLQRHIRRPLFPSRCCCSLRNQQSHTGGGGYSRNLALSPSSIMSCCILQCADSVFVSDQWCTKHLKEPPTRSSSPPPPTINKGGQGWGAYSVNSNAPAEPRSPRLAGCPDDLHSDIT